MANIQLHPLEVHPKTGEPFLRLPVPHEHIILTPPRIEDLDALIAITNDPLVYPWMGPAAPFSREHAENWLQRMISDSDSVIRDLEEAQTDKELKMVDGCPARCIREQQPDGTELFLGHISFSRCKWWELSEERRKPLVTENEARKAGDSEIVWQIAGKLSLPCHRKNSIYEGQIFWLPVTIAEE